MSSNLVSLNVNPCKMCMPMGAVTALYGIRRCMSILHGSQGCSTYIRRHMATHYNEPVDIASSSLTEQGTVFGGAGNLLKGLENLIAQYHPEVIGVETTCLAETIGEDIPSIIKDYYESHPGTEVKIIPISTPGYGGTQYEGFFRALRSVVEHVEMEQGRHNRVNIVTGMLSPADTRYLKSLLRRMGIDFILLPDLSDNLDGVHAEKYSRLPEGGTPISEIAKMGGSKMTIELSAFIQDKDSPAAYLYERYGVPFVRMNTPVALKDIDAFVRKLRELGGKIPEDLERERGRLVDAMIDSHKYCAEARASVYGEPDLVHSVVRLCCENGVIPVLSATGSVCPQLKNKLTPDIKAAAQPMFIENYEIIDDADFDTIEKKTLDLKANIMIGNSDGRRISEKYGLPLIRRGFPVHDRVGGQRLRMIGYEGSLQLLDSIANTLLKNKEETFRSKLFDQYYTGLFQEPPKEEPKDQKAIIAEKTATHPCYNCNGGKYARMHLPVAPKCNIQCNYCVRKFDCPNESRPGVTTQVLNPQEAFEKYMQVKERMDNLKVVGIAGPGDALADFENTKETLRLIREHDPEITFCLSTNGLLLPLYAQELIDLGVTHVTVTLNAVDPSIGSLIYKHVDYMGTRYHGETAAAILLANQLSGIRYLTQRGIMVKINTVLLKGINEQHVEDVVKKAKELGCEMTNIMQLIPVQGSAFADMPLVSNREIMEIRKKCEPLLKQMYHCKQCRADAIGTLNDDLSILYRSCGTKTEPVQSSAVKTYAVASKSGMLVDEHFGHATEFYIYECDGKGIRFKERRKVPKYCTGVEECDRKDDKMEAILKTVEDCTGILAMRIGHAPSEKLRARGIEIYTTYDRIEDAVKMAAGLPEMIKGGSIV